MSGLLSSGFFSCSRFLGRNVFSKFMSSASSTVPLLLTPHQLQGLRSSTDVSILDASWHMPNSPRNAKQEFLAKRIPGARYLDLDEVASSHPLGLKHMMPNGETFARALGRVLACIFRFHLSSHLFRELWHQSIYSYCYVGAAPGCLKLD